jgi:hypothetical protein
MNPLERKMLGQSIVVIQFTLSDYPFCINKHSLLFNKMMMISTLYKFS